MANVATEKDIKDIVRAYADGKTIEFRSREHLGLFRGWHIIDSSIPMFDFIKNEYRIKSSRNEPRILELKTYLMDLEARRNNISEGITEQIGELKYTLGLIREVRMKIQELED